MKKISTSSPANELKLLRERIGLTQEDFAQLIGTSRATVQNWESGRTTPHRRTLTRIRAILPANMSRYSQETRQQLTDALNLILDRAPSTVVEKVSELLTHYAGQYADATDRPSAAGQTKGARR